MFCNKWGLELNMAKSNIIVFRNGGYLKKPEKWYYRGSKMQIINL